MATDRPRSSARRRPQPVNGGVVGGLIGSAVAFDLLACATAATRRFGTASSDCSGSSSRGSSTSRSRSAPTLRRAQRVRAGLPGTDSLLLAVRDLIRCHRHAP